MKPTIAQSHAKSLTLIGSSSGLRAIKSSNVYHFLSFIFKRKSTCSSVNTSLNPHHSGEVVLTPKSFVSTLSVIFLPNAAYFLKSLFSSSVLSSIPSYLEIVAGFFLNCSGMYYFLHSSMSETK